MPNWTTPVAPSQNIVRRSFWKVQIIDNERALNDIIGHSNGGHQSFADGASLIGNGQGVLEDLDNQAMPKGYLIVGDGITTPRFTFNTADDQLLRADSTQTGGVTWELVNWDVAEALVYG